MHRLWRGFDYVVTWFLTLPSVSVVLLISLRRWRPGLASVWLPAGAVIYGSLLYAIWVGGDFMPLGRFLFPAVPFVPLLFAAVWSRLAPAGGPAGALAPGLVLLLVALNTCAAFDINAVPDSVRARFHFRQDREWESEMSMRRSMHGRAEAWSLTGRALARVVQPGESMILGATGAIGYYSGLEVYDTYGLFTPDVVEGSRPLKKSSPGHDVRVEESFFFGRHPTFLRGLIVAAGATLEEMGVPAWSSHPWSRLVVLERHPLPPEEGFAENTELLLLRFERWE